MGLAASRQEAFWESCGFGHLERAKYFLEEGDIDVNWVSYANECCPIHVASQGKPAIVKLLLDHNCDVNVRDNRGNLPLHHAAMKGHADIVQTLINAGSEINAQEKNGWTALHNAAYWCHIDVVKILLNNGCDVNIHNKDERTVLHECARSQQRDEVTLGDIARLLIKAGCDINNQSSDWGEADLTGLMYAAFHNHPDVATALIEAGCELNNVGTTYWSALHWAADRGNDELVYILLEAGIDPTLRDMRGEMAKDRAKSDEMKEVLTTAVELHKEMNKIKNPVIKSRSQLVKPAEPFKPKCDASFKSQSFLPKEWKPMDSADVKNLIKEKKRRLAEMTSQAYRKELAYRTNTEIIIDSDIEKRDNSPETPDSVTDISENIASVNDISENIVNVPDISENIVNVTDISENIASLYDDTEKEVSKHENNDNLSEENKNSKNSETKREVTDESSSSYNGGDDSSNIENYMRDLSVSPCSVSLNKTEDDHVDSIKTEEQTESVSSDIDNTSNDNNEIEENNGSKSDENICNGKHEMEEDDVSENVDNESTKIDYTGKNVDNEIIQSGDNMFNKDIDNDVNLDVNIENHDKSSVDDTGDAK